MRNDVVRFLVIDGYTRKAREELVEGGASMAADLYSTMLARWSPRPVECDALFPSDENTNLPGVVELKSYDGIAWTGCSLGCNDGSEEVESQVRLQKHVFEAGVPSFGSCWAIQIAVAAAGGKIAPNPRGREMGLARKIRLTPDGESHPLHKGRAKVFDAFTSHDDEVVQLPEGATVLSGNSFTSVQSACVRHGTGVFWGMQYHPEYNLHELARLTFCRIRKLIAHKFFRDEDAAHRYVIELESLHRDPHRKDLAWKLGIDSDVMDETVRCIEVKNWIESLVIPTKDAPADPSS